MYAIDPKILWFNWMKVTLRSRKTAYIHCTELVWPRTFKVRSWCNRVEWLYGVGLCLLYCTVLYCTVLYCTVWPRKLTLRSQKISIKWLWPVKVTLKVIKRQLLVFCWSCDEGHLKWDKKIAEPPVCHFGSNEPNLSSQFEWSVNTFNIFSTCRLRLLQLKDTKEAIFMIMLNNLHSIAVIRSLYLTSK